jgi:TolB-like protein/Flp pilus assembly protein TadD
MRPKGADRKLAAILAVDVVGFSRLIGADEEGTLDRLNSIRRELLDPTVAAHHGRVFKNTGDGCLAEFASAVDAVRCALEIQSGMARTGESVDKKGRIEFRIGINVGDVVEQDGDILGDGVNIAARLEAIAEPGEVLVSHTVYDHARSKQSFRFDELGERLLRNIERPVRVFRASWGDAAPRDERPALISTGRSLPLPDKPSIAVLPFDNLSSQPEETYFSDGITEDIITGLARFRSLFVVARNSSFVFRGKEIGLAEIGRQLGVSYLLEGSVRRSHTAVRINAQLIEAATNMHIWAERYDRALDDVFAVQEQVAQQIVSTLVGRIQDDRLQRSLRKPTASLVAYDCLLRGLAHFRGYAEDDNQKAHDLFTRAVELDPNYALARAYVAQTHIALNGRASAPPEVLDRAFELASSALELDPQEGHAHRVIGQIWLFRRDYDTAERHYRLAVKLNPNDPDRKMALGYLLTMRGRFDEALDLMDEAFRLNPFQPLWYGTQRALLLYSLKRYVEAVQELKRITTPGYWARTRLAACYGQLGRTSEAQAQVSTILHEKPDFSIADFLRYDALLERAEDREHLRQGLIKAGLPE